MKWLRFHRRFLFTFDEVTGVFWYNGFFFLMGLPDRLRSVHFAALFLVDPESDTDHIHSVLAVFLFLIGNLQIHYCQQLMLLRPMFYSASCLEIVTDNVHISDPGKLQ
eukprot:Gregarina_sp_Poly_1__5979@NODE_314_length_9596_cov_167_192570_g269_i0_p8_GENE_NODE_314_length_9596_cov_167_192570_g269_i0NODE_314_length_9596_cov_167_192570_g269_i0_p8_ORF_typecomplete_len108_score7_97_NODE_314_length_9596_cov_167_192570_g269_i0560883